ncbi:uncharacterized protein LOC123504639 [Portunus trituberculatus]|uniref:uncharacterized protein LOC123504639 n=1 Tax=Portunus trituberculatus TaxID=210409 RepID=UPI001E1D1D7F|nr:uncharacterized protein LOC123504639 [Portunus trituberculatus]
MGGKARWRKLQRVVGCLPQGPHASVDKPRQRRERARTRDAKRRRLGEDGEENADTILIGSKKEIKKEDEEHKACENKNENDKEADKPHLEQEKELEDKIKTEINDTDNSSYSEKKVQEAMEQRAGVWTASPNGWVFRPLSDTTLEEELRKAQEEEDENGKRDRIHENGQRVAKFFLSDDESDSDTAIFIDAYQPVAPEDKDSQSSEAPVTSPCHSEALQRDGLLENSSGFLVQSQVQVPLEAEDVELVLADAIEEDEISETVDPLAKISTMEAVVTDCMRQDSQMAVLPSRFLEAETASDQTSTDLSIESAANSVNKQLPCLNKTDAATSSGSTEDRDCIKSESADGQVGVSTMKKEVEREADAAQDTFHQEADTESHSTPDIPTSKEQVQLAMITEATIENSSLPKPDSGKEVVDAHDTRGDNEAENLFFSLYPEYHPGEPEENDSRSPCDVAQDIEDSVDVASQKVNDQDGQEHPKDFQEICDASQTANLAQDSSSDDSPTSVVDPVATSTPEIVPRTILHKSDSFHRDLHQLESSASCQGGLEEAGAEAGQDALELESRLESERARQTLVGKAREWIKGVARMGATKRVDSSYGNQPILEATEDTCSHSVGETDDDNEVFTVPADTLDGNSTEVLAELESSEDVKVFDMPKEDQEACFTPDEDENDIPESGTNLSTQQIPQGNTGLQSSSTWDSWRCSPPDRGVLEDDARVQDAKESSTLDIHTKATAEVSEDLNFDEEGSHSTGEDWNATQQNITQLSPGVGDVIDHYPPEEKVHYSSPANEEQDYFTPGMDVEDNLKAIHDGNIYLQPPATQTLQACYPLPDPVVFPSAFEDSYDGPTPADYHTPYPKPIHDSGLHETPEEEVSTPYTPVEELKIICSSVELLQAQYTHEKGSAIHDLLAKRLQTHHTPEDESIIHDSPAKEQEAYNTPDNKDMEQNYTPANTETCYTFSEEYSSYHTPAEKQGTCIYIGGMNYDNTPTKGSTTYKPAEEKDGDYISKEEEEEAQLSHYTPAEEQENLNTPEREESVHHYARVEGEKFQHVSEEEEEEKGYHTPAEEHWTHYTPADEQYTCCTPTDEINGFSTSAEDGEAIHTPVNEPNAYYETAEEDIIHCEPDEESFARDEEQESHNTPHITHSTDKEAGTESNVINEPTEANLLHSTSDNKLSTPAERDEDAHTPSNDYNTPDTCAPDEGVTLDTRDTDLESHYIPDSHLETRQEEKEEEKEEEEEEEEKENEEKGENIAEKRVEDEDNKDEEGRDDYFEMNRERTESERGEKDSEGEEKNDSEKEERKNRGREGRKDSEREERADMEKRRPSDWEWRKNSGGEERRNSDWEKRRNERKRKESKEGKKQSETEGSTEEHTATQAASATGEAAGVLGAPVTSGAQSAAATLDSHTASEDVGASRLTVLSNPSEGVISDHTDVPQRGFRGGREKNNRELKSHQKHGKARHQHTSTDNGDAGGKASVGDEYAEDAKREDKSANKRRRNRRNKGKYHGEQETGITHPQSATGRDWTPSRNAEAKFFSHGGSWEMEVSHERDIHYQNKEYHSQRQESCSPRENFPRENSGTSAFFQKPTVPHQGDIVATSGSCKRSNKNVPYQKKQQQANYKDKFSECQRESYRRVERLSEEQKAEGAGEFAVPGSLGSPGSTGYQNGERRRNKGNEKGSRRCEYGEDILQEKFAPEGGESVEKPPLAKIWSPRIERKDKKDSRKERRERKVFDKYGEELKKGVSGTPGRGSASHSRPPLLETPVEGVTPSGAQKREVKPSSGSLLGSPPPPPPPSCTTTKLRYPEALSQPLSPPPSPPLNKAREMKEKTKPTSGEMEKIKEAYLTSDPPSYARKAASQSVMYTIPETAPVSPQQTEKGAPNPQSSKLSQDRPQCTPKSSSHKDTSEHQAPDQTKSPVSQDGKQTRGSSCKSPPPPSCHASHSPKQQSTSSTVDPQTSHEKLTSASHSSFPPLASPPPSQQESFRDFVGTPISKSPLKLKPEIDTSQKTDAAEEEISTGKPNAGSEKPPGSPGRLSVAQRMKFPELQISAIETKAEESHTDAVSRKTDVPQASSTMAAKLSAESKEDDAGSASPRHASPFARTISTQKIVSKLPRGSEASPQSPSPSHLTSSSSSCTDRIESDALQTSDKSLQEAVSSPRLRQSDIEFAASESLSDSKSCEGGPSEPQSPSQLAKEDWTASASKQSQQGHSSSQEGFPQKEGSMPRSRDTKVMKKKRRR